MGALASARLEYSPRCLLPLAGNSRLFSLDIHISLTLLKVSRHVATTQQPKADDVHEQHGSSRSSSSMQHVTAHPTTMYRAHVQAPAELGEASRPWMGSILVALLHTASALGLADYASERAPGPYHGETQARFLAASSCCRVVSDVVLLSLRQHMHCVMRPVGQCLTLCRACPCTCAHAAQPHRLCTPQTSSSYSLHSGTVCMAHH